MAHFCIGYRVAYLLSIAERSEPRHTGELISRMVRRARTGGRFLSPQQADSSIHQDGIRRP
ncbi:hypothetical protein PG985_013848 [Apiospora marii]|uniref:Uncharacterized protein n=1 Tax=Apiospora marii TaxID=335849 RepID=A0ABR1R6N9_9PEZI